MNKKIKVRCIKDNAYGFAVGKEYDAYAARDLGGKFFGVIDDFGEEYAFPRDMFEEVINTNERQLQKHLQETEGA